MKSSTEFVFVTDLINGPAVKFAKGMEIGYEGGFRAFMLAFVNHFLANEWDGLRAQKRGGGQKLLEFDAASAEQRLQLEPATDLIPGAALRTALGPVKRRRLTP